jgi:hypothetical protein
MRSPITALIWEILRRNRRSVWIVAVLASLGWLFNLLIPDNFRTGFERDLIQAVSGLLMAASILFVFGISNFTETNPGKDWSGFPYRLFALPVSTLFLVTLPMVFGVVCLELVFGFWAFIIYPRGEIGDPWWFAGLLAAFMVLYQAIVWCLAGFRLTRILALGLAGPFFVVIACLPFSGKDSDSLWFSEKLWGPVLSGVALLAFGAAWFFVARQRCGGGRRRSWIGMLLERVTDALPRRRKAFASAAAAQFWFEWRRSGYLLPLSVAALLLVFIGPLSWWLRDDPLAAPWLLAWTLALPLALAAMIGKGFSRTDFWSNDQSLPSFIAIRPLATGEMVVVKMKVAALSAALCWLMMLGFLSLWLPLWANFESLRMVRVIFWMIHGHTLYPQYAIAALFLIAAVFVTWKFLVGGLWIGLSGSRKLFVASAACYCLLLSSGLIGLTCWADRPAVRAWIHDRPDELLSVVEWLAALAVIAKFWIAAATWRRIAQKRVQKYLFAWLGATLCLIALMLLLWGDGTLSLLLIELDFRPLDVVRLRNLLILTALLVIPFARLGLAPMSLAKNRHR